MADQKISELDAATALAGTEVFPVVQGGSTKKATIADVVGSHLTYSPTFDTTGDDVNLGSGALQQGHYVEFGELVFFTARIVWGSSPDEGSGFYQPTIPVVPATGPFVAGGGFVLNASDEYKPYPVLPVLDDQLATSVSGDDEKPFLFLMENRGPVQMTAIAGGAAGDHVVTGISPFDRIVSVIRLNRDATAANIDISAITGEFTISDDDEINNTGGTNTTGDSLLVTYQEIGFRLGDASALIAATNPFTWAEGDIMNIWGLYRKA